MAKRVPSSPKFDPPYAKLRVTLVTNGGTAAVPPAAATSAAPVKKLLEGGVRLLDKGTRLVTRPIAWAPA